MLLVSASTSHKYWPFTSVPLPCKVHFPSIFDNVLKELLLIIVIGIIRFSG